MDPVPRPSLRWFVSLPPKVVLVSAIACGGRGDSSAATPSNDAGPAAGSCCDGSVGSSADGSADGRDGEAGAADCLGSSLLKTLGKSHVLVGAQMEDATATLASFDLRYL